MLSISDKIIPMKSFLLICAISIAIPFTVSADPKKETGRKQLVRAEGGSSKAIGVQVGEGPWRVILSQEGQKKRMWNDNEVQTYLDRGYATWNKAAAELQWQPRYFLDGKRFDTWDGSPSGTIWRMFPKTALTAGVTVRFRMKSTRSQALEARGVSYHDTWSAEEERNNLRRVSGTGDFRIGLLQTGGSADIGQWHAYQVRINPYLHKDAKSQLGESDTSNSSFWYRSEPGAKGLLMDDYSQEFHRFTKLRHKGELKFGMGPHAPYDEWFDIEVHLKMEDDKQISSSVKVFNDKVELDSYKHVTKGFAAEFDHVDAVCLSFNNMRPYCDIRLTCDWDRVSE